MAKLTDRQKRFIELYCSNGYNGTQAAIDAGYSEKGARTEGARLLTNANIRELIKIRLDQLTLTAEELTKKTADIARGNLADYMKIVTVEHTPRIRVSLRDIIEKLEFELILQEEFCAEKGYTEEQYDEFQENVVQPIQDKILKYSIELKHNPNATRVIDGETQIVEESVIDMPKLIADKERGIIKSFKNGKNGLEVELYSADAAMDKLMRVRGMYKDNLKLDAEINGSISPENWLKLQNKEE